MKVKVLAKADESMRLLLEETEPAYANSLRRVLVSDVPKMAIEAVDARRGIPVLPDPEGGEQDARCTRSERAVLREPHAVHVNGGGRDPRTLVGLRDVQEVHGAVQGRVREGGERPDADRHGVRDGRLAEREGRPAGVPRHPVEAVLRTRDAGLGARLMQRRRTLSFGQVLTRLLSM